MFRLINLYHHLPIFVQNIAVAVEGYRIKKQRYGDNFQKYLQELEKSQWFSCEQLEKIQLQKLKKMIDHAYKNVHYYTTLFNKIRLAPNDIKNIDDLKKIPILEKQIIREHRDEFIAKNIPKRKLIPYATGGTTGSPLTLYVTKDAIQYNFACGETRTKYWAGVKYGDRLATFLGKLIVPPCTQKPPFWRYNKAYNQILFSSFHMNEQNLDYYIEEFNRFKPEILQGYVSTVYIFAKYILNHHIKVSSPTAILLSSETLFDWQRKEIEKAFGSKIYNGYSLAEFVVFISECENGSLHMSPEYGITEFKKILNEKNKYEIIGTTLFNYAMPLIRYKTGDIVTLSDEKKCPCGRQLPMVESIEGRSDGMIVTPENRYISPASLSLVFQSAENIKEAQMIQSSKNMITLRLIREKNFSEKNLNYIEKGLKERLGSNIIINIEYVNKIERTNSGKFQFIISHILK